MENKYNESTPLRPEGDRVLDAKMVHMDLNQFIEQVKNESTWKDSDRNSITIFKSDSMTIVLMGLRKDAELKTHTAKGVIKLQVLSGNINFTAENQTVSLGEKQMIALHEKVPHSVLAVEESFVLLTMVVK